MIKKLLASSFSFALFLLVSLNCYSQNQTRVKIDSLLILLKTDKEDTNKINHLNLLAAKFSTLQSDSALIFCNDALRLAQKLNWNIGTGQSYIEIAFVYYQQGDFSTATQFYLKAISAFETAEKSSTEKYRSEIKSEKADALNNLGRIHDMQGEYADALKYYLDAMKVFEDLNDKDRIARSLVNIGIFYSEQGIYSRSIDNYFQAIKIFDSLNNKNGIAKTYGNMGIVYEAHKEYAKALDCYFKALKIKNELGDTNSVYYDYANIATVYSDQKDYAHSLEYYLMGLKKAEYVNDKFLTAIILNNIGEVYDNKGDLITAQDFYSRALKGFEMLNDKNGIAAALGNIGYLFFKTKKYNEAEKNLVHSLALYDSLGALNEIIKTNKNLGEFYFETGNFKKASEHFQRLITVKDSVFSQDKTREITLSEVGYEQAKKDAAIKAEEARKDAEKTAEIEKQKFIRNSITGIAGIVILSSIFSFLFYKRKRDAVQKQKETALNLQVSETEMKALRSQMNPHFIFNALQSIQTFLISHKPEEANAYLLKFSKLMRLVLENSQYTEVSLKEDVLALELYMQLESIRLPHPFTYQFHIDDNVDIEETTIPPLILQPFVENAIWHGLQYKSESGHINIYIRKKNNELHAIVEDNGIGRNMSSKVQQPMLIKKESLGMKLTEERLKILNQLKNLKAQFKVTDLLTQENKPAGTRVELSLSLAA